MKNTLSDREIAVTHKIVDLALYNSARALSTLIREEVTLQKIEFRGEPQEVSLVNALTDDSRHYLLVSSIEGELPAESFLIFSEQHAQKLWEVVLPESHSEAMKEAILLEVDNILTASVITSFSDFLELKAYGGLPSIQHLSLTEISQLLHERMQRYDFFFSMQTNLIAKDTDIHPEFIWCFGEGFSAVIRQIAQDEKKMEKLDILLLQYEKDQGENEETDET